MANPTAGRRERGLYLAHAVPARGGIAQIVVAGDREIAGFSAATGEKLWWVQGLPYQPKASPTVDGEVIYYAAKGMFEGGLPQFAKVLNDDKNKDGKIARDELPPGPLRDNFRYLDTNGDGYLDEGEWTAFYQMGTVKGYLLAVRPDGGGDLTAKATLWKTDKGLPTVPTPLVAEGILYMVRDGGILTAVDAATGAVAKQGRIEGALGAYYASLVAANGRVLTINQEGKAAVLRAGAQWELMRVNDLGEECWATPALAGNRLIVRTARTLYSFAAPAE